MRGRRGRFFVLFEIEEDGSRPQTGDLDYCIMTSRVTGMVLG